MNLHVTVTGRLEGAHLHLTTEIGPGEGASPQAQLAREVTHKVVKLEDATIRAALIALGWTPPPST